MSFTDKVKSGTYLAAGTGLGAASGIFLANAANKTGLNEVNAILEGVTKAAELGNTHLYGAQIDEPTELNYSEETVDNLKSASMYAGIAMGGIYGASNMFDRRRNYT